VIELLRQVGLGDRLEHFPRALSDGEPQRLAVARAVAKQPLLSLRDEPTVRWSSRRVGTCWCCRGG